jgi:succinate dehydrogenase / fumarate reductase cytochrome b subunit
MADPGERRPVFLNLLQIQIPVGALTSITHRVTGIVLAFGIPVGIYLLDLSLQGPQGYARASGWFDAFAFRLAAVLSIWALAHHVLAGIRHLLSDVDIGSQLPAARRSAWMVNCGGIAVALLAIGVLL